MTAAGSWKKLPPGHVSAVLAPGHLAVAFGAAQPAHRLGEEVEAVGATLAMRIAARVTFRTVIGRLKREARIATVER